jgi:hypothetical protein
MGAPVDGRRVEAKVGGREGFQVRVEDRRRQRPEAESSATPLPSSSAVAMVVINSPPRFISEPPPTPGS